MTDTTDQAASTPAVAPSAPPAQAPSIGRIVHVFSRTAAEDGTLESHAAIVTGVHGTTSIDATVFPPSGGTRSLASVSQGTSEGQWAWPPRA